MSKMSDRPKDLRPREKLAHKGAAALSDYELLMATRSCALLLNFRKIQFSFGVK